MKFPKQVFVALTVTIVLGSIPLYVWGNSEILFACLVGAFLSTLNVLVGYAAIQYSAGRSYDTFMKYVLGGMGLRMMVMLALLLLLIKFGELHVAALTFSLFGFYMMYLGLEVLHIHRNFAVHKQA